MSIWLTDRLIAHQDGWSTTTRRMSGPAGSSLGVQPLYGRALPEIQRNAVFPTPNRQGYCVRNRTWSTSGLVTLPQNLQHTVPENSSHKGNTIMRGSLVTKACVAASAGGSLVLAYPGMGRMNELIAQIKAQGSINSTIRHEGDLITSGPILAPSPLDSTEVIGDLVDIPDAGLTVVGRSVRNILVRAPNEPAEGTDIYPSIDSVPDMGTPACRADVCCIWWYVGYDMYDMFTARDGSCTKAAQAAIRLGFHDAAGWSKGTAPIGGADGSIVLAPEEMARRDNRGLAEIVDQMQEWYDYYNEYGVGMADLIQFGATVAAVSCPQGPRIRSFIGRIDSRVPAPEGLLPPVEGSAEFNIELFVNKTIMPNGLAALLGAHTTSNQRFVNADREGDAQDSSPGYWDTQFYRDTLAFPGGDPDVFTFQSDVNLSLDPRTGPRFLDFARMGVEQRAWNAEYAREYVRLSMLGVYNINNLVECTRAMPPAYDQEWWALRRRVKRKVPSRFSEPKKPREEEVAPVADSAAWLATYNRRLATNEQILVEVRSFLEDIHTFQNDCVDRNTRFKAICARYDALFLAPASTPGSSAAYLASQRAATTDHNLDVERYGAAVDALQAELVVLECDLGLHEHRKSRETAAAIRHLRAEAAGVREPNLWYEVWRSRCHGRRDAGTYASGCIEILSTAVARCAAVISEHRANCASINDRHIKAQLKIRAEGIAMRYGVQPSAEFMERPSQDGLMILQEQGEAASTDWTLERRNVSRSRIERQEKLLQKQLEQKNTLERYYSRTKMFHQRALDLIDDNIYDLKNKMTDVKAAEVIETLELWVELVDVPDLDSSNGSSPPESTESR
ncbi:hypothetical protein PoMZ_06594 [Pyricularia oryzae]|uniref:Peroxidase n=1 Tax=Pyricularia oryzae TaxID=318829 RepID=A0A4P7NR61_PYROR|nr:hypothetical protein PoMZ_06594 [Pyricularia oryzae]